MLIRPADPARDGAPCAAIYAPFVDGSAVSFEERVPSTAEMSLRIERTRQAYPWLVAQAGEQVTGFAYASRHRERAAYRWAADVSVYVAGDRRRHGIARALYEALFKMLARQGLFVACAGITLPNEASVGLHLALGFTEVGVYRRIGFKLGSWHDVAWWQKELRAPEPSPADPRPPSGSPSS